MHSLENLPSLRSVVQFGLGSVCVGMVAVGLYLSSVTAGGAVVLDRPGTPARLVSEDVTATAFFEVLGDELELTMLFSEPDDSQGAFRSRVRLADGQRHTIVVGELDAGPKRRFVFRRVGDRVEMRLDKETRAGAG